jgi:hypothetical protein
MRKLLTFLFALAAIVAAGRLAAVVSPASAQVGGLSFPGPGPRVSSGGGGGRTCTDDTASTNFLIQFGGSAPNYNTGSARYADAICVFVKALETAGLITGNLSGTNSCGAFTGNTGGFDGVWLMKARTSANSLLNVCGTANPLVNHGTTFTADAGYTGAAASYIDTQLAPNAGINCLQDNCSHFAGTSTNFVVNTDVGSMLGSPVLLNRIYPHYSDNSYYYGVNNTSTTVTTPTPGHFYGGSRTGTTTLTAYIDTTGTGSSAASGGLSSYIVLLDDDKSGTNPFTGVETFAALGAGVTGTQEAALQAAYATYAASVP